MSILKTALDARVTDLKQLTMAQFKAEEFEMKMFVEGMVREYTDIANDPDMLLIEMLGGDKLAQLIGADANDDEIAFMQMVQVAAPAYGTLQKMMNDFDAGKWPAFAVSYQHLQTQVVPLFDATEKVVSFMPGEGADMAEELAVQQSQFYGVLRTYGFAAIAKAPLPAIPYVLNAMTAEEKKTFAATMNAIAAERGDQQIIDLVKKATEAQAPAPKTAPKRSGGPKP